MTSPQVDEEFDSVTAGVAEVGASIRRRQRLDLWRIAIIVLLVQSLLALLFGLWLFNAINDLIAESEQQNDARYDETQQVLRELEDVQRQMDSRLVTTATQSNQALVELGELEAQIAALITEVRRLADLLAAQQDVLEQIAADQAAGEPPPF